MESCRTNAEGEVSDKYILDSNRNPVAVDDAMEWAQGFKSPDRGVAKTQVYDGCEVSTVFLGLNHQFGEGPPLIFETMVFGGPFDQEQDRYSTWAEAEAGHARMVDKCQPILTEDVK